MGRQTIDCILNGVGNRAPVQINDLEVLCTYENGSVQPNMSIYTGSADEANISLDKITFVNEAAHEIIQYFFDGANGRGPGIMQAMPVQFVISNEDVTQTIFDGFINFLDDFVIVSPVKVECRIVKKDSLQHLDIRLQALSWGYLQDQGAVVDADFTKVQTITRPFDRDMQLLQVALLQLILIMQAAQILKELGGTATLWLAVEIAYVGAIAAQLIKYTKQLFELVAPTPKANKGMTYRKGMQKLSQYLGYGFNSSIGNDLDWVDFPSKPDAREATQGILHISDYGYKCNDYVELILRMFNARIAIRNGVIQLHNIGNSYWSQTSTHVIADARVEKIQFNTDEYVANKTFSFLTDQSDEWTIKNFTGTVTEVITGPIIPNKPGYSLNKGLSQVNFGRALGNNSGLIDGTITALQNVIAEINAFFEDMESRLPKLKGRLPKITFNIVASDFLKVSAKTWNTPKVLYVVNGKIPTNHRQKLSSAYIYATYHSVNSMLPSNPMGQKRLYENIKQPFNMDNFLELQDNSFATTSVGNKQAKVTKIVWKFNSDYAIYNYWVHTVWESNLKETIITP